MATYTSQYPPAQNGTYVKATTLYSTSYYPYFLTDPAKSLTGTRTGNEWLSISGTTTNQRFHIDLGSAKVIKRIYYESEHSSGVVPNRGVKDFILQGSDDAGAFADLTYATDTNWTALTTSQGTFDEHVASDVADPKYITVTNSTAYRYYAFKFANNWGGTTYMGMRRIELQTEDAAVGGFMTLNKGWL